MKLLDLLALSQNLQLVAFLGHQLPGCQAERHMDAATVTNQRRNPAREYFKDLVGT